MWMDTNQAFKTSFHSHLAMLLSKYSGYANYVTEKHDKLGNSVETPKRIVALYKSLLLEHLQLILRVA